MVALGTQPHSYVETAANIPSGPDYTLHKRGLQACNSVESGNQLRGQEVSGLHTSKRDHRAAHRRGVHHTTAEQLLR